MMSGSGQSKKAKPLIQTKLSFTSSSPGDIGKGIKRKLETDMSAERQREDDEKARREKPAAAAENRRANVKTTEQSGDNKMDSLGDPAGTKSRYFGNGEGQRDRKHFKAGGEEQPSTSRNNEGKKDETQEYDMTSGSQGSQDLFDSDPKDKDDSQRSGEESDEERDYQNYNPIENRKPENWSPKNWKGTPKDKLPTAPSCLPNDIKLEPNDSHCICFKVPFVHSENGLPQPFTHGRFPDKWDADHVRMPCSDQNEYPVDSAGASVKLAKRWELIKKALHALKDNAAGSFELEEAILSYNQRYANKWNFTALHRYFTEHVKGDETKHFFEVVLPQMIDLALRLPNLCSKPIPLLKKGRSKKVTLSQQQISCLLANAFFCTFPRRNSRSRNAEYSSYPDINFNNLFQGEYRVERKLEKLACIINYFKRVCYKPPTGVVTFSRQCLQNGLQWRRSLENLSRLHVSSAGTIEDDGVGMLQVDFANKYMGGGALNTGLVQEEIRFMICPEMIVSRLITEVLGDKESLVMTGCEQFSDYEGYADTFRFKCDHTDKTPRDSAGRLCCEVVAIDALVFRHNASGQFKTNNVERELNKAYCGFHSPLREANRAAVCTGNWGCGAFGGDKQLKSLIQMMAASVAKRDVCYFTFGDEALTNGLHKVHGLLEEKTVGDIFGLIESYNREVANTFFRKSKITLFEYIHTKLEGTYNDSDFDDSSNECQGWDSTTDKRKGGRKSPDYKAGTP